MHCHLSSLLSWENDQFSGESVTLHGKETAVLANSLFSVNCSYSVVLLSNCHTSFHHMKFAPDFKSKVNGYTCKG